MALKGTGQFAQFATLWATMQDSAGVSGGIDETAGICSITKSMAE